MFLMNFQWFRCVVEAGTFRAIQARAVLSAHQRASLVWKHKYYKADIARALQLEKRFTTKTPWIVSQKRYGEHLKEMLKNNLANKIFGYLTRCEFWAQLVTVKVFVFCRVCRNFDEIWCEIGFSGLGFREIRVSRADFRV